MPLLFKDYTNLVIKAYEEKREANRLSRLQHLTTANIRKECLNVFDEKIRRGEQLEENTLRAFFGMSPGEKGFRNIIENYKADKFKPLQSLIKREINNPSIINVELLAWLIDFKPRPLAYAQKILATANEHFESIEPIKGDNESLPEAGTIEADGRRVKNGSSGVISLDTENLSHVGKDKVLFTHKEENKSPSKKYLKINVVAAITITIAVLLGGIYFVSQHNRSGQEDTGCMYWANDHYEPVPCNEERKGRFFLPLDEKRINSFKMITKKDTITEWSIGKIYYIQDKKIVKYYTEAGDYPEDHNRSLRKLSRHIFEKDSINRKLPN